MCKKSAFLRRLCALLLLVMMALVWFVQPADAVETILRVAVTPSLPPYQFLKNDELCGLHIDVMNRIGKLNNYSIEYVITENTDESLNLMETGKVDIILGVIVNSNADYYSQLTNEISQATMCLLVPNDKVDAVKDSARRKTLTASFEKDTISYTFMINAGLQTYVVKRNQFEALQTQRFGLADVVVGVKSSLLHLLEERGLTEEYVIANSNMAPISYAAVVSRGDRQLMDEVNAGLAYLQASGAYGDIYSQWITDENEIYFRHETKELVEKYIQYFLLFLALALIVILMFVWMNRTLKERVREKTAELQRSNQDLEHRMIQMQRESELRNRILESSPMAMIIFNEDGEISLTNQSTLRLLGLKRLPVGQDIMSIPLCARILKDRIAAIWEGATIAGEMVQETRNHRYHDSHRSYRCTVLPVYIEDTIGEALLIIDDITAEVQAQETLLEKEKSRILTQLVAGISHEIKNPLMSIKMFIQLIAEQKDSPSFWDSFMKVVPTELDRINRLVEELIAYAKPPKGTPERVFVREVIESCTYLIKNMPGGAQYELKLDIPEALSLMINHNRFKQIMINIILNGLESMETKRTHLEAGEKMLLSVDISAGRSTDGIYICVTDHGVGMTEEEIEHATEPFYTTKSRGTGMGLAVTRQFVEENGGKLLIQSEKNQYTRIILMFRSEGE